MTPQLDPWQVEGVAWLLAHPRGGLWDEMRVGKTAPAIRAAVEAGAERILVLCPSIAVTNWQREIIAWDPDHAARRWAWDVISVDTYARNGTVRLEMDARKHDTVILDEYHYLRRPTSLRAKAVFGRRAMGDTPVLRNAKRVWMLSGTPAPNNAAELWAAFHAVLGQPRTEAQWIQHFCVTRETKYGTQILGNKREAIAELRELASRFFLRRTFRATHGRGKGKPPLLWNVVPLDGAKLPAEAVEAEEAAERALGMRLRGITEVPEIDGAALAAAEEHMSRIRRITATLKIPLALEYLREYLGADEHRQVLILGHHTALLHGIADGLRGYGCGVITGATPSATRTLIADRFQSGQLRAIAGNIVACGVAINLSRADAVVFAEISFTPGDNLQAGMRAVHRSKSEQVPVDVLVLANTVDDAVARVRIRKLRMLSEIHNDDGAHG